MVRSYNDPAKQKAREKLTEFIGKNLLNFRKPNQVRVVCFPGAEVEGEEALEIKEVYDSLGIPRKNIIGLEYNPESAERLRKANLGINIVESEALDFFKTTDQKFHVISLDYTGQRTWKEKDITRYIAGRGLLGSPGIFCTNHLIRRESKDMQNRFVDDFCALDFHLRTLESISPDQSEETMLQKLEEEQRKTFEWNENIKHQLGEKKFDLDVLRSVITAENVRTFGGGRLDLYPSRNFLINSSKYKELFEIYIKEIPKLKLFPSKGLESEVKDYLAHRAAFNHTLLALSFNLERLGFPKDDAFSVVNHLSSYSHGGYVSGPINRYIYTSNKNANMLTDMVQFKRFPYKLGERLRSLIDVNSLSGKLQIYQFDKSDSDFVEQLMDCLDEIELIRPMFIAFKVPEYLGSSWHPPKRLERISESEAKELLGSGYTPKEIVQNYRGFSLMQLAAFKAHQTMGTYQEKAS